MAYITKHEITKSRYPGFYLVTTHYLHHLPSVQSNLMDDFGSLIPIKTVWGQLAVSLANHSH